MSYDVADYLSCLAESASCINPKAALEIYAKACLSVVFLRTSSRSAILVQQVQIRSQTFDKVFARCCIPCLSDCFEVRDRRICDLSLQSICFASRSKSRGDVNRDQYRCNKLSNWSLVARKRQN